MERPADDDLAPNEKEPPDPLAKLRKVALTCLYLLIIAATLWVLGQVLARLFVVVVPIAVAILVAALFAPGVTWLANHGVPRGISTAVVLLGGLALVGGLIFFAELAERTSALNGGHAGRRAAGPRRPARRELPAAA